MDGQQQSSKKFDKFKCKQPSTQQFQSHCAIPMSVHLRGLDATTSRIMYAHMKEDLRMCLLKGISFVSFWYGNH